MKLVLVRHGDAVSDRVDPRRPLSAEGRDQVKQTALFLAQNHIVADRIWHSKKERARETARIINDTYVIEDRCEECDGMNPDDEIGFIVDRLKTWMAEKPEGSLVLVGHNPFLPRLAAYLATGRDYPLIVNLRQAGAVCLQVLDSKDWVIDWIIAPEWL